MSMSPFIVQNENPNDNGTGGCVCSPVKVADCVGPFVVIPGNEMDATLSPHVVVGLCCVNRAAQAVAEHEHPEIAEPIELTSEDVVEETEDDDVPSV